MSTPWIVGHRGVRWRHGAWAGNSYWAFLYATAYAAQWVECDIQLTADEQIVVVHNPDYEDKSIAATRYNEWEQPPLLFSSLLSIANRSTPYLGLNIELKTYCL